MNSSRKPTGFDSPTQPGEVTIISSFGEKLVSLIQATEVIGALENLLPDPEIFNGLLNEEEFAEWSQNICLDVVTEPELEAYGELKGTIKEEEVEKALKEALGSQENKVCITQDVVGKDLDKQDTIRTIHESLHHAIDYVKDKTEESNKNIKSLEKANEQVSQEITKTWSSINDLLKKLSEKWNELSQQTHHLYGQKEEINDSAGPMLDETFFKLIYQLQQKLLATLESISQQLAKEFNGGAECAVIFSSPRLEEIQIEDSDNELVEMLDKCQELMELFVCFQTFHKDEISKKRFYQEMPLKLLDQLSSSVLEITDQFKTIKKYDEEVELEKEKMVEQVDIALQKLSDLNQALTDQSTLVTPENFISSLTNFSLKLEDEEAKCAQDITLFNEKQVAVIAGVNKFIGEIDQKSEKIIQCTSKLNKFKAVLLEYHQHINNLNTKYMKEESTGKERLHNLMILCSIDFKCFTETLQEIKKTRDILANALVKI